MPSSNYIPAKDADFQSWLLNFSTLLTASPTTYGLVAGDATAVAAQYTAWHAAYLLATDPGTRTSVTVAAKDVARANATAVVRPLAVEISRNAGVLAADKVDIGVNPNTSTPTPVPAPTTVPVLSVDAYGFLTMDLRYRDESAPATSRAEAVNAIQIEVVGTTSATVVSDPATLPRIGVYTKVPVRINWSSGQRGETAYISARWVTRTGLVGPWAAIITPVVS